MENLVLVKNVTNSGRIRFVFLPRTFDLDAVHQQDVTEEGHNVDYIAINFMIEDEIMASVNIEIPADFLGKCDIIDVREQTLLYAGGKVLEMLYDNKYIDEDGDVDYDEAIYLDDFKEEIQEKLYDYLKDKYNTCNSNPSTPSTTTLVNEQSSQVKKRSNRGR